MYFAEESDGWRSVRRAVIVVALIVAMTSGLTSLAVAESMGVRIINARNLGSLLSSLFAIGGALSVVVTIFGAIATWAGWWAGRPAMIMGGAFEIAIAVLLLIVVGEEIVHDLSGAIDWMDEILEPVPFISTAIAHAATGGSTVYLMTRPQMIRLYQSSRRT